MKRLTRDDPRWGLILFIAFIAAIWGLLAYCCGATAANRPYYFADGDGLSSVKVYIYKNGTLTDSITQDSLSSFPASGNIVIDDHNQWRLAYWRYFAGGTDSTFSDEIVWGRHGTLAPSGPSGSQFCTVYGIIYDLQGNYIPAATITFVASKDKVKDSCSDATIFPFTVSVETNDTGYYETELLKSSCTYNTAYKVTMHATTTRGTVERKEETFTIPADSSTYLLKY